MPNRKTRYFLSLSLALASALVFSACGGDDEVKSGTGPAAKLKCASSGKNAFDTYGSNAFVMVNKSIFSLTTAELNAHMATNVGTSFSKVTDFPTFEGKLAAFLVYVYGGPESITYTDNKVYQGKQDMVKVHTGMAITSAQYDYFVTNVVVPALKANGVKDGTNGAPDDITTCFAPPILDATFKASIVGH